MTTNPITDTIAALDEALQQIGAAMNLWARYPMAEDEDAVLWPLKQAYESTLRARREAASVDNE